MDDDVVAATWEDPSTLEAWANNPRHNQPIAEVARSIRELGFGAPIVAQLRTRRIIAGHTRWFAAQQLGLPKVPVRFVDIDDRKAELMVLADNKLNERADWDEPKLAMLAERHELEDLALVGFEDEELMALIRAGDEDVFEEDDESQEQPVSTSFAVIIECTDEAQQLEVLEMCQQEGLACRALT